MTQTSPRPDAAPGPGRRWRIVRVLGLVLAVACALWLADHLR